MPSISVFFPCYNDEKSIGKLVDDAFTTLRGVTQDYEVIVIDDGSTDKSREVLEKLAKKERSLKLVFHDKNEGYGGALKTGFATASKELVFYTDGDGQYDVKELPVLLSLMTRDVNFVNGIKMPRQDPTIRLVIGNLYALFVRWAFWLPIYDVDCDFRLIRREIVKRLKLKSDSGSICVELIKKAQRAGAKFRQVSVHHYERRFGQSQFFRPGRILRTLLADVGLWLELMVFPKAFKN
ncbi:MAG: glycosyltransferase family 2 protein [Candidatus Blackburnbacteria bacterium]|nr:glycosyltransferase family 2 protein [Candidatus Blackburnbacteria bacterium]